MDELLESHPSIEEARIDKKRRAFLQTASCVIGGVGAMCALVPLGSSLLPSKRTEALAAPIEVDISTLASGQQMTVSWRGKPVWIIRRTPAMLEQLRHHPTTLRDPDSVASEQPESAKNEYRSIHPEYLVLIGICTHLGCSPKYVPTLHELGPDWDGGFYCPCHGSTFDLAGRVYQGVPAPINLEVPPYYFKTPTKIVIGENTPS
ncbi:MAG: ubiquinol-cytochrome c reductase iron-sulfur subunit [Legionellaceae bacterium]|nr:ubiquinol-cytochrome c reductase iron-sulfur subunit [Legionellaceae bacterium]